VISELLVPPGHQFSPYTSVHLIPHVNFTLS